jgi:hypothetical protein
MFSRRWLCATVFLAAWIFVGCSDPYEGRKAVNGTVKLAGQPLKEGSILFMPLDKQSSQSGAAITNGEYRIPRQRGLKPGKYLVQLTAGEGRASNPADIVGPGGSDNVVSFELIPEEYNTKSQQKVEVQSSGTNQFDFEIPKVNTKKRR